jgi:hypothetical protein
MLLVARACDQALGVPTTTQATNPWLSHRLFDTSLHRNQAQHEKKDPENEKKMNKEFEWNFLLS